MLDDLASTLNSGTERRLHLSGMLDRLGLLCVEDTARLRPALRLNLLQLVEVKP